ncbi:hypothetical protein ACT9XH_03465 [Methanococcoides methylutens]|uniref:hypothetical protein n=1 Tax=Methanococcoides methylutens TaxID=2226 RepID=UPI0040440ADB
MTVARKVIEEFQTLLNKKVKSQNRNILWSYVFLLKAKGLSHHLVGKRKAVEFSKPVYMGERHVNDLIPQQIHLEIFQ